MKKLNIILLLLLVFGSFQGFANSSMIDIDNSIEISSHPGLELLWNYNVGTEPYSVSQDCVKTLRFSSCSIFVTDAVGNLTRLSGSTGSEYFQKELHSSGYVLTEMVTGNLDSDSGEELLINMGTSNDDAYLYSVEMSDGTVNWNELGYDINVNLMRTDVNNDTNHEYFIQNDTRFWFEDSPPDALNSYSKLVVRGTYADGSIGNSAAGDITGDGVDELIYGVDNNIYARRANGDLLWYKSTNENAHTNILLADINYDGKSDIIAYNSGSGELLAMDGSGAVLWESNTAFLYGRAMIGDIDADGRNELIIGSDYHSINVHSIETGELEWSRYFSDSVMLMGIGDLNNDSQADILAKRYGSSTNDEIIGIDTSTSVPIFSYPVKNGVDLFEVYLGDFNLDDQIDILTTMRNGSVSLFYLNNAGFSSSIYWNGELGSTLRTNNPNVAIRDQDSDTLTDSTEIAIGTDVDNADTDGDGLLDGEEVKRYGSDPLVAEGNTTSTTTNSTPSSITENTEESETNTTITVTQNQSTTVKETDTVTTQSNTTVTESANRSSGLEELHGFGMSRILLALTLTTTVVWYRRKRNSQLR